VPAAAALARSVGGEVEIVLLDGDDAAAARQWEQAARKLLAAQGGGLRLRAVPAESRDGRNKGGSAGGNR